MGTTHPVAQRVWFASVLTVALLGGCSGGEDSSPTLTPPPAATDAPTEGPTAAQTPSTTVAPATASPTDEPPPTDFLGFDFSGASYQADAFSIIVDAKAQLGVVGQVFELSARATGGVRQGALDWAWSTPGTSDGVTVHSEDDGTIQLSFAEPGRYRVRVVATDRDGNSTRGGALIRVYDPIQGRLVYGDINGDGDLSQGDADLMAAFIDGSGSLDRDQILEVDIDRDGDVDDEDLGWIQGAVNRGEDGPTYLSAEVASAGGQVFVTHPAILDPRDTLVLTIDTAVPSEFDANCQAALASSEGLEEVIFTRGRPGLARFAVPPSFACLREAAQVDIVAHLTDRDGAQSQITLGTLDILPLPEVGDVPGELILESIARLRLAMEEARGGMEAYAFAIDMGEADTARLLGSWDAALALLEDVHGGWHLAFDDLDPETAAMWERMARGAGLGEAVSALRLRTAEAQAARRAVEAFTQPSGQLPASASSLRARPSAFTPAQGEAIVDLLCALSGLGDLVFDVISINIDIGAILSSFADFPIIRPQQTGPILSFLLESSLTVFVSVDIGAILSGFIPELGDDVRAKAQPGALLVGESTQLSAEIDVILPPDLCSRDPDEKDTIEIALQAVFASQLTAEEAVSNQVFAFATFQEEEMQAVFDLITQKVEGLIPAGLSKEVDLSAIASFICDAFADGVIPLEPSFLEAGCSAINGSSWTCVEDCATSTVGFSGEKDICGEPKAGTAAVLCSKPIPQETPTPATPAPTEPEPTEPVQITSPPVTNVPDTPTPTATPPQATEPQQQLVTPPFEPPPQAPVTVLPLPMPTPSGGDLQIFGHSAFGQATGDPTCPSQDDFEAFFKTPCGPPGYAFEVFLDFTFPSAVNQVVVFATGFAQQTPIEGGVNSYFQLDGVPVDDFGDTKTANLVFTIPEGLAPGTYFLEFQIALPNGSGGFIPSTTSNVIAFEMIVTD